MAACEGVGDIGRVSQENELTGGGDLAGLSLSTIVVRVEPAELPNWKATGGGTVKKGKKASGSGGTGATGSVTLQPVDEDIEEENMDEIDSEAELDSLVKAVRTAQTFSLIGAPLAVPRDAGSWFVARRETLRNCAEQLAGALISRPARIPAPS